MPGHLWRSELFSPRQFLAGSIITSGPGGVLEATASLPLVGITRLLIGVVFCAGIVAVIIAGAELFTGNNLIVMAWASGKVTTRALLYNWVLVFVGNFAGAFLIAGLMYFSTQYTFGGGAVGVAALATANAKSSLSFVPAFTLRNLMQRACVPCGLDVFQRQDEYRSGGHRCSTSGCIRRRRLRALRCKYVFHSDGVVHQSRARRNRSGNPSTRRLRTFPI